MANDNYIRFRCTEVQKAQIKAYADANAMNMSEYILSLVEEDSKYYFEKDIYAVHCKNGSVETKRELIATVLCDNFGRIPIEMYKKIDSSFKKSYEDCQGRFIKYECEGEEIQLPVAFASYVCIDKRMFNNSGK